MEKEIKHNLGAAGGYLVGRSHANNGIKAINKATGQPLEMEGGEVVITKPAVEDTELREFEGEMLTNRQILSRINVSGGGVSFADGGEVPNELYFDEQEYSYGGEKLPGHVIAYKISSCGCNHEPQNGLSEGKTIEDIAAMHNVSVSHIENQIEKGIQVEAEHTSNPKEQVKIAMDHLVENPNYYDILAEAHLAHGGELESLISQKFNEGFGKVKYFEINNFGGKWTYAKNPSMTRKQIESSPVYVIETSEQERNIAQEKRSNYEKSQPKEISISDFALKLAKENNLKITHISKSGSVYLEKPNKETIRVSDHFILDRDSNNPKTRHDLEIVQKHFSENDSTNLSDYEETYAHGGNLKKGAEIEDLDNVVQVSDEVLDGPNIIPEQATLFAEGGQVINPIVEDWDDVPANYKNTNKVKKVNFANNPIDKGLDSIISPFLGNDILRPVMSTIHFDKNGITATNAHVLITLPYPNEKYEGSYDINRIKKEKSSELLLVDETYPKYENVIPLSENAKYVYKIDVYKLLQYAQTAINYSNKVTYQAVFKFGDNEKIGFNLNFLQIILKTWLKLGHEEIYISMTMPNRAAVFSSSKDYEVGKDEIILLMPTLVGYGMKNKEEDVHFGAMDIDYGRHLKAYFDFNDGEIHNSDGSIANFQMQYSNNLGIGEDYLALLQKMTSKSRTLAILNYVKVLDGKMYATDLKTSLIVKNVDLRDGIYEIVNKAPNITMYPIEDFPKERVFNENEFHTIGNVFNGSNETPGDKRYTSFVFKISSEAFEYYLDKLLLSVGKDDLRPTMMGICIHKTEENEIFLVSTDANTLCKINITEYCTFKKDDRKLEYIMNVSYLKEAFDLIEGDITVKCSSSNVFIESETLDVITKNEDGKYPNYEAVIPYKNTNIIKFKHAEISKCLKDKPALEFVNKYKSEKGKAFYITSSGEKIFLVLASESYGSSNVSTVFDKLELCSIGLSFTEEQTSTSSNESLFLMMPMRLSAVENQYFAFKKNHFEILLKTVTDTEITCYYSEAFKPYLFPIEEIEFKKTLPEEKEKQQKDKVIVDKKVENKIKLTEKNQLPEIGKIIDFGEGLEKITRIATFSNGKEYIEAKRIDGSSERLNLYPLSEWENILKNQENFNKLREERELSIKERKETENQKIFLENNKKNEYNDIDGFAENKTPLQKSKILKYLNSNFRNSSVKNEIRKAIINNGFINIDKSGLESIRYKEDDKTYILNDKLQTKTALEYAKYLISINYNQLPDVGKVIGEEPQNTTEEIENTIAAINLILPSLRGKEKTEAKDTIVALKLLLEPSSFEKGGPILLAPNGKPSNLDAEMYHLVRTPQFKAWFGYWENNPQTASKVVDENGEPLVVYHGTNVKFNEFKSTKFPTAGYFAKDITYSKSFAKTITEYRKGKEILMSLFLNIRKPFDTSMLPGDKEYSDKELKKIFPIFKNIEWGENYIWGWMGKEDVINAIKENGYDGIIFNEMSIEYWKEYDFENEMENLKTVESYIAFEPNQIKLADGTNTTFDANTNDIRYAKGGVINKEYNLQFKPIETPLN